MYCPGTGSFTGNGPIFTTLLMVRPSGNVTMLPLLLAYQFTSMLGDVPTAPPSGWKIYEEVLKVHLTYGVRARSAGRPPLLGKDPRDPFLAEIAKYTRRSDLPLVLTEPRIAGGRKNESC